MAIAFVCPGCGRKYKAPDSVAGKKTRCKACGEVITVPAEEQDSELDIYALDEPDGKSEVPSRARGGAVEGSTPPLRPGERIDTLRVVECSSDRFVLESTHLRLILFGMTGVVSLAVGLWLVGRIGTAPPQPQGPTRVSMRGFFLLMLIVGYGFTAVFQLARLGYRMTFERDPSCLTVNRLFFWETLWPAEELDTVAVFVSKPNHERGEGDRENQQYCEVFVVNHQGKAVAWFEMVTHKHLRYFLPLAQAALHAARVLDLPIHLDLRGQPMHAELRQAVELIRRSGLHDPDREGPALHRRVITVYVAAAVATVFVMIIAALKIFLHVL